MVGLFTLWSTYPFAGPNELFPWVHVQMFQVVASSSGVSNTAYGLCPIPVQSKNNKKLANFNVTVVNTGKIRCRISSPERYRKIRFHRTGYHHAPVVPSREREIKKKQVSRVSPHSIILLLLFAPLPSPPPQRIWIHLHPPTAAVCSIDWKSREQINKTGE